MEPLRLPSDEEIGAAYNQGKDAVITLFHQTLGKLAERIQRLEDQIAKISDIPSQQITGRNQRRQWIQTAWSACVVLWSLPCLPKSIPKLNISDTVQSI